MAKKKPKTQTKKGPEVALPAKTEVEVKSGLSGLFGFWQWLLGGEAKTSFGTAVFLTCMIPPFLTCLSVAGLLICVGWGKVALPTALSVLRIVLGWPMVILNIFVASVGVFMHLMRKHRDMVALKEIAGIAERLMLANKGNAAAFTQAQGSSPVTATTPTPGASGGIFDSLGSALHGAMAKVGIPHHPVNNAPPVPGAPVTIPGVNKPVTMPSVK